MNYYYQCPPEGGKAYCIASSARRYGTITLDLSRVTALQLIGNRIFISLSDGAVLEHWSESIKEDYEKISADLLSFCPEESE